MTDMKETFSKKLMTLVFPIAFQQFMLSLVSASDALMLGQLSQDALSAVSLASQIAFVENLFLAAMTIGLSMLAAQYWGKKDSDQVERIFAFVLKITAAAALVFSVVSLCLPEVLMKIFTSDPVLVKDGAEYLRTVSPSFFLTGLSQIYICILKNTGHAGKSSLISTVSVVSNILLNSLLIFGLLGFPKLGIAGAAFATVVSRLIELAWCICETLGKDRVKLRAEYLRGGDSFLRRSFWKYTAPVLGNETVWGIGFTMYSVIMGHLGNDAVAANSIANVVKNLVSCFCIGLGSGGGIMTGNELGAGRLETAKEYGRRLCRLAIITGAASGAVILAMIPLIGSAANLSAQAGGYLKWMLAICAYYMVGKSVNSTTIAGIFCAGGDSKFGFLCDTVTMWCVTVPLGFISAFVLKMPVPAVYFIISLDEIIKLPAVYRNYKKYRWVKNLTAGDTAAKGADQAEPEETPENEGFRKPEIV